MRKISTFDQFFESKSISKFDSVYMIMTQEITNKCQKDQKLCDIKRNGIHFLAKSEEELINFKVKYPLGGTYKGSKIIEIKTISESELIKYQK